MIPSLKSKGLNSENELYEVIDSMVNGKRDKFHLYTIHRLVSLCLLNNFGFEYMEAYEPHEVRLKVVLGDDKYATFRINTQSQYGTIENSKSLQALKSIIPCEEDKNKWSFSKNILSFNK